jgi:hypothetical protein
MPERRIIVLMRDMLRMFLTVVDLSPNLRKLIISVVKTACLLLTFAMFVVATLGVSIYATGLQRIFDMA